MRNRIILLFLSILFPFGALAQIVPACQTVELVDPTGNLIRKISGVCSACHIFSLIQNIINYLYAFIAPFLIIILIYGGFLMVMGASSPQKYQRGKDIILKVLVGICIVFMSWLAVDFVLKLITGQSLSSNTPANVPQPGSLQFGPWNKINCTVPDNIRITVNEPPPATSNPPPTAPQLPPGGAPPPPTPGQTYTVDPEEQQLAQTVLAQGHAGGASNSCGSVGSVNVLQNITNGTPPPVCFPTCSTTTTCPTTGNVHISKALLTALVALDNQGFKFTISSLTTGRHTDGSSHYTGHGVDIVAISPTTYAQLQQILPQLGQSGLLQCEDQNGAVISCTSSATAHIHANFP